MAIRKVLLNKLLEALIEEWGRDEVKATLDKLLISSSRIKYGDKVGKDITPRKIEKPSAKSQVETLNIPEDKKKPLLILADRFDQKEFLAKTADVRHFIIMLGERPTPTKDRGEAFRSLLRYLLKVPANRLEQIAQSASYSGLARLGPISDAISAAGERLPRPSQDEERNELRTDESGQ